MDIYLFWIACVLILFEAIIFWWTLRITNTVKEFFADVALFVFGSWAFSGLFLITLDWINYLFSLQLYPEFWVIPAVWMLAGTLILCAEVCALWPAYRKK